MSRINLNKNKAELQKAWEDLHKPNSKNDWVVFGYDGKTFDLKIVGTGEDGFEEMIDDLSGGKIMYAGCRVNDPNTNLPKIVFVNWQGEGVPTNVKGTCANHIRDVTNFFRGAHVTVTARSEDDLDYDTVLEKVKNSSGSNYSFHKEKPKPAEKIKPVGAVYKKTNPMAEINTNNRDKFWSQQQKEEQSRQEQEKLKIEKEREEEDRKRRDREAKEAAARDQAVRERSQSIDKQRAAQRALEQKKKDEEKRKYQETLKDAEIQDREFRKRSDSERRKRLMEAQGMIRQRTNSIDKERQRFEAPAEKKLPPPTIPKKVIRKPVFAPAEPTPEPTPEPIREPIPEPIREPSPEPIREPTPEPIREPTPEPVPEPIEPEPQPEIEPEPVQIAEPVVDPQEPAQPSIPEDIYDEVTQEEAPVQDDIYENIDESFASQPVVQEVHQEEAPVQEDIYENIEESPHVQPVAQEAQQPSVEDSPASTAGCTARALYDYQAEGEDEITFDPDDIITNIDKFDEGWWRGTAPSGKSGIFPSNYVEVISDGQSVSVAESTPAVEETPAAAQGLRARALYDYQATDDTEITFDPDDIITDIEQIDEGWWRGAGPDGRYGLFPANYVELI